jgi:hypothetical protein
MGNLNLFNEHDTPPPVLFMQGSCIFEIGFIIDPDEVRGMPVNAFFEEIDGIFMAHVKVVAGSGDMLYHFDNNKKDALQVEVFLKDKHKKQAGAIILSVADGNPSISVGQGKKLDNDPAEKAMHPHRLRFRCRDESNNEEVHISGVQISKIASSGSTTPLYAIAFDDLRKLKADELNGLETKVMLWFEDVKSSHADVQGT